VAAEAEQPQETNEVADGTHDAQPPTTENATEVSIGVSELLTTSKEAVISAEAGSGQLTTQEEE
jgi:hypothetical protein